MIIELLLLLAIVVLLVVMLSELRDIKNQLRYQSYKTYSPSSSERPPL